MKYIIHSVKNIPARFRAWLAEIFQRHSAVLGSAEHFGGDSRNLAGMCFTQLSTTTKVRQIFSPWIGHLNQELHGGPRAELFGINGVHQELEEPFAVPDLAKRFESDDIVASGETLHKLEEPGVILLHQPLTE